MFPRLAPLSFVVAAACSVEPVSAPQPASAPIAAPASVLVGTWERRVLITGEGFSPGPPGSVVRAEVLIQVETFRPDGGWTAVIEGYQFPPANYSKGPPQIRWDGVHVRQLVRPVEAHCAWQMLDEDASRIRVRMQCDFASQEGNAAEVTKNLNGTESVFTVINSDELRTTSSRGDIRMVRIAERK